MKRAALLLLTLVAATASAEPSISQQGAPDANGVIRYWVKCENGNVAVAECLKDQRHCGAQRDQPIAREATAACEGIGTFTLFKGPTGH